MVEGIVGQSLTWKNVPLRNITIGAGGYGHGVEILCGKKWQTAFISPLRIGKADAGISYHKHPHGFLEGGIWYFAKDKDAAESSLKDSVRAVLMNARNNIDETLKSV